MFDSIEQNEARALNDTLAYPVLFCWRQYLELIMKKLTVEYRLHVQGSAGKPIFHHKLADIWAELRPLMVEAGGPEPDDLAALDEVVAEFVLYDPDSFAFRYPTDKSGNSSQAGIPSLINLKNLNSVMTRVANFLDASCDYVGHYLDMRADYAAEMASLEVEFRSEYEAEMEHAYGAAAPGRPSTTDFT